MESQFKTNTSVTENANMAPMPKSRTLFYMAPYMVIMFIISMWIGGALFHTGNRAIIRAIHERPFEIAEEEKAELQVLEDIEYGGDDSDDEDGLDEETEQNTNNTFLQPPPEKTSQGEEEEEDEERSEQTQPQNQPRERVERELTQNIDFSSVQGDANWKNENEVPQIRFELRQQMMEERCQTADLSRESFSIIKSNKIGIFFQQKASACLVNKSGSTTWRAHLQRVNKSPSIYQQKDRRWKAFMSQPDLPKAMAETSRIITVRHPLTRLVSAYRQRYENGKIPAMYNWNRKQSYIRKYFSNYWFPAVLSNELIPAEERANMGMPTKHSVGKQYSATLLKKIHNRLGTGFVFTFPMFLRHVVYTHTNNIVDNHWKPIDWLCSPCLLHYNYIVKLESMTEDAQYVFNTLHIPSKANMQKNKERLTSDPWTDMRRYDGVPLELKEEIIRIYWNDIFLFGYELPPGFLDA